MTSTISELLGRFERGSITRRELIGGLAMLVAAQPANAAAGLRVNRFDHASLLVSDLQRSHEFYTNVFAASVSTIPRPANEVRLDLATGTFLVLRRADPPGQIDHLCVTLEGFDKAAVTQKLTASGVTPVDAPNDPVGFHFVDPDGFKVQIVDR